MNRSASFQDQNGQGLFLGGNGDMLENAVIVNTRHSKTGIDAEYEFVAAQCGVEGKDWRLERQRQDWQNGVHYDVLAILLNDGSVREFYFNISKFFGNRT